MTVEQLTALVLALGVGPITLKLIDWIKAIRSGKAADERRRNRMALNQLENEMSYRRILEEYASRLRRLLIDIGFPEDKIPDWPARKPRSYQ
jgi:hypothetical protein